GVATGAPNGPCCWALTLEGQPEPASDSTKRPNVRRLMVSPEFFDVLNIGVRQGRKFSGADRDGSVPVAIVTEDFARKYFPGGDALGRRIRLGVSKAGPVDEASWLTIVGITPVLIPASAPNDAPPETVLLPVAQSAPRDVMFYIATAGSPIAVSPSV